jgi:hypothetical protein
MPGTAQLSQRAVTVKVRGGLHACRPRGRQTPVANLRLWLPQAAPPPPPTGFQGGDGHGWPVPVPLMKAAAPTASDVAPAQGIGHIEDGLAASGVT